MAQRLVRAKRKISEAGIPYRVPPAELLPPRLASVLAVLYLIFNQGYDDEDGQRALTVEAIRLARVLAGLMPHEPEPRGLLSLMLLHESRRGSRTDNGVLITLEQQDRSRWDQELIAEGVAILDQALAERQAGPYQVQAAIAASHATAADVDTTDWTQIADLYGELARLTPSPVIELNRAVAVAMADGVQAGLSLLVRTRPFDGLRERKLRRRQHPGPGMGSGCIRVSGEDQSSARVTSRPPSMVAARL
jgi:RNA polymerase sigma-70 factor (ECF subfamily)